MTNKILTILIATPKIHPAMKLVFPKLKTQNKQFVAGTREHKGFSRTSLENRVLIRWGSRYETADIAGSVTYNPVRAVKITVNKKSSRETLFRAGVKVPRTVTPDSKNISFPLIARPRYHSRGENFIVLNHRNEFIRHYTEHIPEKWYYSEYVNKAREFRVHVAHGKILCVLEKPGCGDVHNWNWARTNASPLLVNPDQWDLGVVRESIKAVKTLRLDFSGVDVIVDEGGRVYVVELNTMPGMLSSVYAQEQYAKYFDWLAASDVRRPRFDVESENPMEYVWKE